jgi:hypothetical protein
VQQTIQMSERSMSQNVGFKEPMIPFAQGEAASILGPHQRISFFKRNYSGSSPQTFLSEKSLHFPLDSL